MTNRMYTASTEIDGTCYKVLVQTSCPANVLCDDCDYLAQHAMDVLTFDNPVQNETGIFEDTDGAQHGHGATARLVRNIVSGDFMTA
jgi:hypothetical protein